jgi:hypothetical protein
MESVIAKLHQIFKIILILPTLIIEIFLITLTYKFKGHGSAIKFWSHSVSLNNL